MGFFLFSFFWILIRQFTRNVHIQILSYYNLTSPYPEHTASPRSPQHSEGSKLMEGPKDPFLVNPQSPKQVSCVISNISMLENAGSQALAFISSVTLTHLVISPSSPVLWFSSICVLRTPKFTSSVQTILLYSRLLVSPTTYSTSLFR